MEHTLEAVYEGGVFKPLETPELPEHQRVVLVVRLPAASPAAELVAWRQVYSGLSDQDITEIESIALDRNHSPN